MPSWMAQVRGQGSEVGLPGALTLGTWAACGCPGEAWPRWRKTCPPGTHRQNWRFPDTWGHVGVGSYMLPLATQIQGSA